MPALPWTSLHSVDPDHECVVLGTRLPLTSYRAVPRFMRRTQQIRQQLAGTDGVVGYSLDAHPISRLFYTVSAWEDQASLDRFVATEPHRTIMSAIAPVMGETRFESWSVPASSLPVDWTDVRSRLE